MPRHLPLWILAAICLSATPADFAFAAEPTIPREHIEWVQTWIADANKTDLPRVLLVGDSICNAYYGDVAQHLKGKAYVAKLATSAAVGDPVLAEQIKMVLSSYKFAVVHFNVGIHGFGYSEEEYRRDFPRLVELIRQTAPEAKLIWATSTPIRNPKDLQRLQGGNERIKARNRIVVDLAGRAGIPVDDLYALVENHPEYWSSDGIHFQPEGRAVQAKQVARMVLEALPK